ncbi:hypothetical protein C8Q75DRAFT_239864 [Abortiporus biennis]|nr:hypothetical protein C8Q75DRAFT_239864 [Abortiporus biennis]
MADQRHRPPTFSDYSTSQPPRPLKRRYASPNDDPFLAHPSQSTSQMQQPPLQPLPTPSSSTNVASRSASQFDPYMALPHPRAPPNRPATVMAQLPTMDPSPFDPHAVFIHPPFTGFPDAYKYKDGLTYNLMAANPEWFLDPADYITTTGGEPGAIRYPSQLEPPRGWCPTKKRELKEGWPEGEEPRLRCTFCRRTYAGVNAKSMWRRHVYEKHKIAMSNRRDNNGGGRGRGSNKENKEDREGSRGGRGSSGHTQSDESNKPSSSRYRSQPQAVSSLPTPDNSMELPQSHEAMDEDDDHLAPSSTFQIPTSSSTPPLTPGASPETSQYPRAVVPPESPYNPLLTPSFKHSPARLPSDQPWRFPSPSPSNPRRRDQELSLYMLVRGEASPTVSGLDVSPVVLLPKNERKRRSIFSSPITPFMADKGSCSDGEEDRFKISALPSPRNLFFDRGLPTPLSDRVQFKRYRIPESPLGRNFVRSESEERETVARANDTWLSESPTKSISSLLDPIQLDGDNPFASMLGKPWATGTPAKNKLSGTVFTPGGESPVLRSSQSQSEPGVNKDGVGLGIGLMAGFSLKDDAPDSPGDDDDEDLMFIFDQTKTQKKRALLALDSPCAVSTLGKKSRRETFGTPSGSKDGHSDMLEVEKPKKRRRTITGLD